jgi:hypothetical protein
VNISVTACDRLLLPLAPLSPEVDVDDYVAHHDDDDHNGLAELGHDDDPVVVPNAPARPVHTSRTRLAS